MSDDEKRRLRLLQDSRKNYPAIHPRYQATYQSLYQEDEKENVKHTFFLRLVIASILFALFFVMDHQEQKIGTVDSQSVITQVEKDLFGEGFPLFIK